MQYVYTTSAGDLAYQRATHDELLTTFTTADPQIILRYFTHNTAGSGAYYDGFTVVSAANAPNLPAGAMCYLGTGFSAKPHLEDLTAAQFVPRSAYTGYRAAPLRWLYDDMCFPFDNSNNCVGSFVIPKSAYSGTNEVYAYLWLPSPALADDLSANYNIDMTMLAPDSVGMEVMKFSATLPNTYIANETKISAIHSANCEGFYIGDGSDVQSTSFYNIDTIDNSNLSQNSIIYMGGGGATHVNLLSSCTFTNDFRLIEYKMNVESAVDCTVVTQNSKFSAANVSACDYTIYGWDFNCDTYYFDSTVRILDEAAQNFAAFGKFNNCDVLVNNSKNGDIVFECMLYDSNFTLVAHNRDNDYIRARIGAVSSTLNFSGTPSIYRYGYTDLVLQDCTATLNYTTWVNVSATRSYINGTYYEAYTGTL